MSAVIVLLLRSEGGAKNDSIKYIYYMENKQTTSKLPENAYRELKPGEEYEPVMPAGSTPREITSYSVLLGLVMIEIGRASCRERV